MSTELVPAWTNIVNRLSTEMYDILHDESLMGFASDAGVATAWCRPGEHVEEFIRAGWTLLSNGYVAKRASYPVEPAMVPQPRTNDCRPVEGLSIGDVADLLKWTSVRDLS